MAADNTVNVGINVSDNGSTEKVTKNVKELKNLLDQTVQSAARISMAGGTPAPRMAGGGSVPPSGGGAAAIASGGGARPPGGGASGAAVSTYGAQRAVAGMTGSASSDFAEQARGLGGVVAAYASIAATVYAVSAAFKILGEAMNTTHLVQGLEQLGAASGRNLGFLAKQLGEVTGGALSVKQEMQAVAQMSAAQMSGENILKLGQVARLASQALGRDMAEAVDRLSLGISKQQPRLLDELGILVNVTKAHKDYADKVGKSVTGLTDFEKRQAFANATLEQGIKKFGAINIDTNPYQRLEASLRSLTQSFLEMVNKVLVPVVSFFADNKLALEALSAVITTKFIGSLLPLFSRWSLGLEGAAVRAAASISALRLQLSTGFVQAAESKQGIPLMTKQLAAYQTSLTSAADAYANSPLHKAMGRGTGSIALDTISKAEVGTAKAADLALVNTEIQQRIVYTEKLQVAVASQAGAEKTATELQIAANKILIEQATLIRAAHMGAAPILPKLVAAHNVVENLAQPVPGRFTTEGRITGKLAAAENTAGALAAAKAGRDAIKEGADAAKAALATEAVLLERGVTGWKAWAAAAGTSLGSAAASVGKFLSAFLGPALIGIMAAMAIFEGLNAVLSTNTKQVDAFKSAADQTTSSVDQMGKVLDNISKKDPKDVLSVDSLMAKGNAVGEVTAGIKKLSEGFLDLLSKSSGWDKMWNSMFTFFGHGWQDTLAVDLAKGISATIQGIDSAKLNKQYTDQLKTILKTDDLSEANVTKIIKQLPASAANAAATAVSKINQEVSGKALLDANKLLEATGALTKANDTRLLLMNSLKDHTPLTTFAEAGIEASVKLTKAFQDPKNALVLLKDIVSNVDMFSLFPPAAQKMLQDSTKDIQDLAAKVADYDKATTAAAQAEKELVKYKDQYSVLSGVKGSVEGSASNIAAKVRLQVMLEADPEAKKLLDVINTGKNVAKYKLDLDLQTAALKEKMAPIVQGMFEANLKLIDRAANQAAQKVVLTSAASIASGLGGVGKAEIDTTLKQKELDLQIQIIASNFELVRALNETSLSYRLENLKKDKDLKTVQQTGARELPGVDTTEIDKSLAATTKELEDVAKTLKFVQAGVGATGAAFRSLSIDEQQAQAGYYAALKGAQSQVSTLKGQKLDTARSGALEVDKQKAILGTKELQNKIDIANIEKDRLNVISSIVGIENAGILNLKIAAENKAIQLTAELGIKDITDKEADAQKRLALAEEDRNTAYQAKNLAALATQLELISAAEKTLGQLGKEKKDLKLLIDERKKLKDVEDEIAKIRSQASIDQKTRDFNKEINDLTRERKVIALDAQKQELDYIEKYSGLSKVRIAEENDLIARKKLGLENEAATQNIITDTINKRSEIGTRTRVAITAATKDGEIKPETKAAILKQEESDVSRINDLGALKLANQEATNASKLRGLDLLTQEASISGRLADATTSLVVLFGDLGTKIGDTLKVYSDGILAQGLLDTKYASDKQKLEAETQATIDALRANPNSTAEDEYNAYTNQLKARTGIDKKYAKDSTDLEFNKNAKLIGSAKNMFSEKTFAYKALANVEKVMHINKLAMDAKDMAMSLWAEGKKLFAKVFTAEAGTAALAESTVAAATFYELDAAAAVTTATPGIFAKFSEQMGVWGWAAAAAVVAALGFGGGSKAPPAGFTAEEQQKVQGTGQSYVNGKLVDTGGGAFGDITDKSKSVEKSIALMEDHAFKNLDYSNKMLDQLKKIQENTNDFAKTLITIGGFTTAAPTVSGGNWLTGNTSTQTLDKGLKVLGTIGQAKSGTADVGQYENTMTSDSGWLGFIGGGNTPGSSFTKLEERDQKRLVEGMQNMFVGASDALVAAGKELGKTGIEAIVDGVDLTDTFKVSTLGLKGQELAEAIASSISNEMDIAAEKAFPELMSFRNIGEHMAETVARVVDTTRKVNFAFDSIGKSTTELVTTVTTDTNFFGLFKSTTSTTTKLDKLSKETADAMAKLAGGLIPLLDEIAAYSDNFLTEAEKLAPTQSAITKQMAALGFSSITTKDQFKALVNSVDVTTDAGRKLFQNLMEVQDGFNQVAQFEEKLADSRDNQTDTIRKLIGTEKTLAASLKASRDKELKAMDPSLVATQKYINALTDEVAARDKAATAVKSTIDSLKGSVKTLTDYQTSLATGAQGTMTPEQRYAALQQDLLSTQAAAMGPTDTPAQLAAQQAAATKLPQAASAFLDASKVLNASSSKYSDDLAGVQKIIADTITSVSGTQSLAERNLEALGPLVSIDASTKSTAELMQAFVTAQTETETTRIAMNIATDQWQRDLLAKLNPVTELVGPLQPTEAVRLAAEASTAAKTAKDAADAAAKTAKDATDAATSAALLAGTTKITTVNDSLVLSVGALDTSTTALTTAVGTFGLGADTNTASVLTAVNSNLNASTVLDTSMGSLNTNVDDLNFNMSDNTASLGYLGSPAFAAFLAKAIGDAIDTGSIVTAINESTGAQITANATVVANQTVELTTNANDNVNTTIYNSRNYKLYNMNEP